MPVRAKNYGVKIAKYGPFGYIRSNKKILLMIIELSCRTLVAKKYDTDYKIPSFEAMDKTHKKY